MRSKTALYLALAVDLCGAAVLLEHSANAQSYDSLFGLGGTWGSEPSYTTPKARVYPAFKKYVRWHAHAKHRHVTVMAMRKKHINHAVVSAAPVNATVPAVSTSDLAARLAAMQKISPGSLTMFLSDPTLRRSDAVMTATGIFIFDGASRAHGQKDFVSLAYAKPIAHRAELAAIQKVFVQRFEVAEIEKPKPGRSFEDTRSAMKSFETIEPKPLRRIAGIQAY